MVTGSCIAGRPAWSDGLPMSIVIGPVRTPWVPISKSIVPGWSEAMI